MYANYMQMELGDINYHISIKLDVRRIKSSGKYPVKLRVYTKFPRKQKLYFTGIDLSKKEYKQATTSLASSKDIGIGNILPFTQNRLFTHLLVSA